MSLFKLVFDASGKVTDLAARDAFLGALQTNAHRDVLFVAHGWLNDTASANQLFTHFARGLSDMPVCGVFWPSHPLAQAPNAQGIVRAGIEMTSYYVMKERAAEVGAGGLAPFLRALRRSLPDTRIHLAGHSFGARLVTAAAAASIEDNAAACIQSMTLIQAAFSQFSFAPEGAYRAVLERRLVNGPIAVTHSKHDLAVGQAYPVASLLRHQNASAIGGPNDPYGGLGRNGAQHLTPAECIHLNLGDMLSLRQYLGHPVINLNADTIVRNHSDIYHREILDTIRTLCSPACTEPLCQQS